MRKNCKTKIINLIKQIRGLEVNRKCNEVMLIIDEVTTPLLSSIVVQFFSLGVKNITKVGLKKKPQPTYAGIYYISQKSIPSIVEDFQKDPIYHSINILLCEEITEETMKKVGSQIKITQRLAFFGELLLNTKYIANNIALICQQYNLFSAIMRGQPNPIPSVVADKLMQALVSGFQDNFRIKIYHNNAKYIKKLVEDISLRYDRLRELQSKQKQKKQHQQGKTINLLLVDRSLDIISPLVRNFYYLNMVSDTFCIDFQKKDVELKSLKKIIVNFQDPIFCQYKNLHISKVPNLIEPDFKKFKTENKAAQLSIQKKANNVGNLDLRQMIRDIPEFNRKVKSYQQQIQMLDEITRTSKERKLPQVGQIQQMIISGLGGHGEQIKDKRILERAFEVCALIQDPDKIVRIMVLALLCLQISESQKKSILGRIKTFPKFASLATILQQKLNKIMPKPIKLKLSPQKQKLFLHMHESLIETIMTQLLLKSVCRHVGLTVLGAETAKNESKFEKIGKVQQRKWVICVIGDISLNQIVHLERLMLIHQNLDISIISTGIISAWNYLDRLNGLWNE